MNTITLQITTSHTNILSDAVRLAGVNFNDVVSISTHCVEPVRPDGMNFRDFNNLDRDFTVTIVTK